MRKLRDMYVLVHLLASFHAQTPLISLLMKVIRDMLTPLALSFRFELSIDLSFLRGLSLTSRDLSSSRGD